MSQAEVRRLEELRQFRAATAHGLAPVDFSPRTIFEMGAIARRLLAPAGDHLRQRDVADIFAIDIAEAYSVIIPERLCQSLWDYLTSNGLKGKIEMNIIGGDEPQHDIQIEKTIPFREFNHLVNEWKNSYIMNAASVRML